MFDMLNFISFPRQDQTRNRMFNSMKIELIEKPTKIMILEMDIFRLHISFKCSVCYLGTLLLS